MTNQIYLGDNLKLLQMLPDESVDLIYIDPPFNTGKKQARQRMRAFRAENGEGDRIGFGGNSYQTELLISGDYQDSFRDFEAFLRPRLEHAHRVLKSDGSFYFHIDYREAHYCKVLLDQIFGRGNFLNEIIWAYDFGGRAKDRWPAKHDNIFFYVKDAKRYTFNLEAIDRILFQRLDPPPPPRPLHLLVHRHPPLRAVRGLKILREILRETFPGMASPPL